MPLPQGKLMASEETQANVSSRVTQAMEDLALKGEMQREEKEKKKAEERILQIQKQEEDELIAIRKSRLDRMIKEKDEEEKNRSKGHGEVGYITQDEFLPTVLGSNRCVVHFFHSNFERCQIVDERIKILAAAHLEARFVRINAEKAPFFVEKLGVRVLPTLVCFEDGKAIGKKIGYDGETELKSLFDIENSLVNIGVLNEVKCALDVEKKCKKDELEEEEEEEEENFSKKVNKKFTTSVQKTKVVDDGDW